MTPKDIIRKQQTERSFAEAFCIDGTAKIIPSDDSFEIGAVIKLTDSKRGTFYVAQVSPKGIKSNEK